LASSDRYPRDPAERLLTDLQRITPLLYYLTNLTNIHYDEYVTYLNSIPLKNR
jgi:hypothetical protein